MQRIPWPSAVVATLASPAITANQRQRLQRTQAQLDKFAVMPPEQQDNMISPRVSRSTPIATAVYPPSCMRQKHDALQA